MRSIKFKIIFEGEGCVNYDSLENQLGILNELYSCHGKFNDNTLVMKKNYYQNDGEKLMAVPKIDKNKLRYYIFGNQVSPYDVINENITMHELAKWETLCRGTTLLLKKGINLHKKSSFNITDASLVNDAKPQFTVQTSNVVDPTTGKRASTSMFNVETLGKTVWEAEGNIDMCEIQFLSASERNDRMYVLPDWVSSGKFKEFLNQEFGDLSNPTVGYFLANRSVHPEYGILLNNEVIERILKNTLISMLRVEAHGRMGSMKTTSLKIQLCDDLVSLDYENEWINIRSIDDIENMNLSKIDCFYKVADSTYIEEYKKAQEKNIQEIVKLNEEQKLEKANKKTKKSSKEEEYDLSIAESI